MQTKLLIKHQTSLFLKIDVSRWFCIFEKKIYKNMELNKEQEKALEGFTIWLYNQKEEIENALKTGKGKVIIENDLRKEFFRLEDYLSKIIENFFRDNFMHLIAKDDDGNWSNIKISFDFQADLGFIKLIIRLSTW